MLLTTGKFIQIFKTNHVAIKVLKVFLHAKESILCLVV